MRLFAGISYALSFVIATWVGLHLLRMATRTRKAPELGIGLTVFTLGFGTAGMLGGELVAAGGRIILGQLLAIGGLLLVATGTIGLYLAMRQVYRPGSAWATAGVALGSILMIGAFVARLVEGGVPTPWDPTPANACFLLGRFAVYAWAAIESYHYFALLRRRLAIGIADPVVMLQILFWAIAATGIALSVSTITVGTFALGVRPATWPAGVGVVAFLSITSASAIWCAFMPPSWFPRLAERFDANAAQCPVDAKGGTKGSQA
jgi:hypothetical protein